MSGLTDGNEPESRKINSDELAKLRDAKRALLEAEHELATASLKRDGAAVEFNHLFSVLQLECGLAADEQISFKDGTITKRPAAPQGSQQR